MPEYQTLQEHLENILDIPIIQRKPELFVTAEDRKKYIEDLEILYSQRSSIPLSEDKLYKIVENFYKNIKKETCSIMLPDFTARIIQGKEEIPKIGVVITCSDNSAYVTVNNIEHIANPLEHILKNQREKQTEIRAFPA